MEEGAGAGVATAAAAAAAAFLLLPLTTLSPLLLMPLAPRLRDSSSSSSIIRAFRLLRQQQQQQRRALVEGEERGSGGQTARGDAEREETGYRFPPPLFSFRPFAVSLSLLLRPFLFFRRLSVSVDKGGTVLFFSL